MVDMKYYFDSTISFKTFKKVIDTFPDSGPTPKYADRYLWEMLRDGLINIGVENTDDPIFVTIKPIPKGAKIISDVKK